MKYVKFEYEKKSILIRNRQKYAKKFKNLIIQSLETQIR